LEEARLKINEIFYSIQGESLLAGKPSVFVRTATCNLRCTFCDSGHSFWTGKLLSVSEIMEEVKKHKTNYVCVTGGEPLGQKNTIPLLQELVKEKYTVSLETNGSFSVVNVPNDVIKIIDVKCPDSGEADSIAWENLDIIRSTDQLKFVVASKNDFDWAQKLCEERKLWEKCPVLFSPVHGKVHPADLAKWILSAHAPVTMQTQMHKEIWPPNTRGV
jgi:7-carboxy-7-deazaguanine synthase